MLPAAALQRAAALIAQADGLLVTAGAGMGVDSGLPDFRGNAGFWTAYPALGKRRMSFAEAASPQTFIDDPRLAWGFYGHRLALYRSTTPHAGFSILQNWAQSMQHGAFVFTSNVDGQFQKAGFNAARIFECHGSIHHLQCLDGCGASIWPADNLAVQIDAEECQWLPELPRCICSALARPNILMFGDAGWRAERAARQQQALERWLNQVEHPVVIEMGAGSAIPTVRHFGQGLNAPLIRINPTEPEVPSARDVGLQAGALEALRAIDALLV